MAPILIGIGLGLFAAFGSAWLSATEFENYSFVARMNFEPHLVSEAERLRREAALLMGAQSLVDNGLDIVYFFLGPKLFSRDGFLSSSFIEICLMSILGLFILIAIICLGHQIFMGHRWL